MADGFERMVDAAMTFFPKLAAHNSKDWFAQHKAFYKDEIAGPAALFADIMAEDLGRETGQSFVPKVFRIYRDVRFSKDKTPLNAHLHLSWSSTKADVPTWFWGLSPDYFILGMGFMALQGDGLNRFRQMIDAHGGALQKAAGQATISDFGPAPLKRVPKTYAPDHPHGDLLKRKSFALHVPIGEEWKSQGVIKATHAAIAQLRPAFDCLVTHF